RAAQMDVAAGEFLPADKSRRNSPAQVSTLSRRKSPPRPARRGGCGQIAGRCPRGMTGSSLRSIAWRSQIRDGPSSPAQQRVDDIRGNSRPSARAYSFRIRELPNKLFGNGIARIYLWL